MIASYLKNFLLVLLIFISQISNALNKAKQSERLAEVGNYQEAIVAERDYLSSIDKEKEPLEYANSLWDLAQYYFKIEEYDKAIVLEEEILNLKENLFGSDHYEYALALSRLATTKFMIGEYLEASQLVSNSNSIIEKTKGRLDKQYGLNLRIIARVYSITGNDKEAINIGWECNRIFEQIEGKLSDNYVTSLSDLSIYYSNINKFNDAIKICFEIFELSNKIPNYSQIAYANNLNNISLYYNKLGDYKNAALYMAEAIRLLESLLGKNHPYFIESLQTQALNYTLLGNSAQALTLIKEATELAKNNIGQENGLLIQCLTTYGTILTHLGEYEDAIKFLSQALDIYKSLDSNNIHLKINILKNLCDLQYEMGHYDKAIEIGEEARNLAKNEIGENTPSYGSVLSSVSAAYHATGKTEKAIEFEIRSSKIYEEFFGKNCPYYALSISNLANYYMDLERFNEALKYGNEALEIRAEVLGTSHPDYLNSLHNLSQYHFKIGNYTRAIELEKEVIELCENNLGKEYPYYSTFLNSLSSYYSSIRNYGESIRIGHLGLEIEKNTLGTNNPNYAKSMANLARNYSLAGDFQQAIKYYKTALEILGQNLGVEHPIYRTISNNLASCYNKIGKDNEATEILLNSINALDTNSGDYALTLCNIAGQKSFLGDYQGAIRDSEQAINILSKIYEESHPHILKIMMNIALYNFALERYHKAINYVEKLIKIQEEKYGQNDLYIDFLIADAYFNLGTGNYNKMEELINKAVPLISKNIKLAFSALPLAQRRAYWESKNIIDNIIKLAAATYPNDVMAINAYNLCLLSKGILLNSELEFDKFMNELGSQSLFEKYNKFNSLAQYIVQLHNEPISNRPENIKEIEEKLSSMEMELLHDCQEFGNYTENLCVSWKDVKDKLKKNDIAIEFISTPLKDKNYYFAYILKRDFNSPKIISLFEETEIKDFSSYNNYSDKKTTEVIWGNLAKYLEGVENIYFSPDGLLHQIAIEYLPDVKEGLFSDHYNLYRLTSTRQLVTSKHKGKSNDAVVYGGIVYDSDFDTMKEQADKLTNTFPTNNENYSEVGIFDSFKSRGGIKFLEGSFIESKEVTSALESQNYKVNLITGKEATEESFKNLSGKPIDIIHIATHGFYWKEDIANKLAKSNFMLSFIQTFTDRDEITEGGNAMTRSGIFMAGANNVLSGKNIPKGVEDGILTAGEISILNLTNTDLVVLSACQSGIGEITSEGVFGLQRGFKKAGAKSLLMSLWNVDDCATQMLMTNFYQNLKEGMNKHEALLTAQKSVREFSGEINGEYVNFSHPRYWAAFVLLDAIN